MKLLPLFEKTIRFINPSLPVWGLEVGEAFIRAGRLEGEVSKTVTRRLPPGVISKGRLIDKKVFIETLKKLRAELGLLSGTTSVVLTLYSGEFYTQIFNLPPLPRDKFDGAVDLNLAMISPRESRESYRDAEVIGRGATGETELLGAFAPKDLIDAYMVSLMEAGFSVLAVEFRALSVARALADLGGYNQEKPILTIELGASGLDFMIIKNGRLYFQYLSIWSDASGAESERQIDLDSLISLLSREVGRLLNFYSGKWGGAIGEALLVSPGFPDEARALLERQFSLKVLDAGLVRARDGGLGALAPLGAALRGVIARNKDIFISLAPVGTEEDFTRNRKFHALVFWRNIIAAALGFLLLVYIGTDSYLAHLESSLGNILSFGVPPELIKEVGALESEAKDFNRAVSLAVEAKANAVPYSPALSEIRRLSGSRIILRRVFVQNSSRTIQVAGWAPSELSAITFKNSLLERAELFRDVTLPLANIVPESNGGVGFQLTIALK